MSMLPPHTNHTWGACLAGIDDNLCNDCTIDSAVSIGREEEHARLKDLVLAFCVNKMHAPWLKELSALFEERGPEWSGEVADERGSMKCGTFSSDPIPSDVRAKMDEDRAKSEEHSQSKQNRELGEEIASTYKTPLFPKEET